MTIGVAYSEGRPPTYQAYIATADGETFYLPEAGTAEGALVHGNRVLLTLAARMLLLKDYPRPTSEEHAMLANFGIAYDPSVDGKKPAPKKEGGVK